MGGKGGGGGFMGRHCMTCGTHTTANVTAAAFGFNPLLSGSFLKRRDSCECTICSLFRSYHPCRVQRGQARGTDTQIVILTRALSLSFFLSTFFSFLFYSLLFIGELADRPLRCASALDTQVLVSPLCFTLEAVGSLLP